MRTWLVFVVCFGFAFVGRVEWIALMIEGLRGRGLWVGVENGAWGVLSLVHWTGASLALAVVCCLFSVAMVSTERSSEAGA